MLPDHFFNSGTIMNVLFYNRPRCIIVALRVLTPRQREVIQGRLEGMSLTEIDPTKNAAHEAELRGLTRLGTDKSMAEIHAASREPRAERIRESGERAEMHLISSGYDLDIRPRRCRFLAEANMLERRLKRMIDGNPDWNEYERLQERILDLSS